MAKRKLNDEKKTLVENLINKFGEVVTRKDIVDYVKSNDLPLPRWILNDKSIRTGRASFNLALLNTDSGTVAKTTAAGTGTSATA